MPAKRSPEAAGTDATQQAPASPYVPVMELRIRRLQEELDRVSETRPWGPALGFTAAWLGLMALFVGLVERNDVVMVSGVVAMLALVPAFLAAGARRRREALLRAQIEEQERRVEAQDLERSPAVRLLDAHLDHLDRHFRLVADHADRGFVVAVGVAGLGFLLVVMGLVLGVRGGAAGPDLAWVAAASGIAMQGVAAALFLIYARTLGHLRAFQERLSRQQETLLAFHHAGALGDGKDRDRVLTGLIAAVVAGDRRGTEEVDAEVLDLLRRVSS
jgi:membrane protein implicated in regulation of membrane protease activity